LHLPFPDHVHHLVALQGSPRRLEGKEPQSWFDQPFVLFSDIGNNWGTSPRGIECLAFLALTVNL
jgi:hypothetical protein